MSSGLFSYFFRIRLKSLIFLRPYTGNFPNCINHTTGGAAMSRRKFRVLMCCFFVFLTAIRLWPGHALYAQSVPEIVQKLTAADGAINDLFGDRSLSLDGDRALIGAHGDDDKGNVSGSAYIFRFTGTEWEQEAKLTAGDGAGGDEFGLFVSLDGDRALIGAYGDAYKGKGMYTGSAYIFRFNGTNWEQEAKLTAGNGAEAAFFGWSVSLDGDRALIGAMYDDDKGDNSGSAYIFRFNGVNWEQEAKLTADDGTTKDNFGWSVSLDGDHALIGACMDDDKGLEFGSAYIFRFNGVNWEQEDKLTAGDGAKTDVFGTAVSLDGDCALIGASLDDDKGRDSGSAYIFRFNGVNWEQEDKLTAADGASGDWFGGSVSLDGDCALIGALYDNDKGS
ncbi:FG-GAP repeat protein [candidate division KSB1 bacterium]|nr:FG-GAP repeat protein [candidate division KSB1 bacterium]